VDKMIKVTSTVFHLQNSDSCIYLNVTTLEGEKFTIKLNAEGFSVCARGQYDRDDKDEEVEFYETPYALLNHVSPRFTKAFGDSLANKLEVLVMEEKRRNKETVEESA